MIEVTKDSSRHKILKSVFFSPITVFLNILTPVLLTRKDWSHRKRINSVFFSPITVFLNILTPVLLNPDIPCLLIWICTVCYWVSEFISTIWSKDSDWLRIINERENLFSMTRVKTCKDICITQSTRHWWGSTIQAFLKANLVWVIALVKREIIKTDC